VTAVLRSAAGDLTALAVDRWRHEPDAVERGLLADLADPVLDVGCGPGRLAAALAAEGRLALGIDPSASAVAEAHARGASVLQRSVFEPLPAEGRWATVLLVDGNIGIGGDPAALLRRCLELVRAGGEVVAEVGGPGTRSEPLTVRLERGGTVGPWFRWAVVGIDAWPELARAAGWVPLECVHEQDRWFARARRP
jgi:SAM-dependent methyltransferase